MPRSTRDDPDVVIIAGRFLTVRQFDELADHIGDQYLAAYGRPPRLDYRVSPYADPGSVYILQPDLIFPWSGGKRTD